MHDFRVKVLAPLHFNDYLASSDVPKHGFYVPMVIPRTGRGYRAVSHALTPLVTIAAKPSLVHRTYYDKTYVPTRVPTVVTVYDMIHELIPRNFSTSDPTARRKRRSVHEADLVLCISHSTAKDLIDLLAVPREKVRVTHLGFSGVFRRESSTGRAAGRPYLLYVGHRGGYKNFAAFLRAYASSARLQSQFDVVAFGGFALSAEERDLIRKLRLREDAVRRVVGSDEKLAVTYARAHLFVYPSTYEGFGIPPLEAMAAGSPVVCSNTSSLTEVVADAAELFDPTDEEDIARAMELVAFDESRRMALVEAGYQRLAVFSWDRCAEETARVYSELL
jgi:glycosyltransferase involved in cell wall biosynthesis